MELQEERSKAGYYEVYQDQAGETYIILEGLSVDNLHEPSVVESFTIDHYETIVVIYWLLLATTLSYLLLRFFIRPLMNNSRAR